MEELEEENAALNSSEDKEETEAEEVEAEDLGLQEGESVHEVKAVSGMYQNWFLEYASYVILERAVPAIEDGLKPVQRRILHAMREIDDGRFNKVANVIGQTMQYHPHGDAAIGDAMVNLGQKELLIETQGNWGDIRTGDSAAAPRYIEARLSKFALEVAFNNQTTSWALSYDGRKREPVTLPMKFPLLLAQGVEGIAVGLSTKVMPHNFIELINASIDILRGKRVEILPDFPTGGFADFSNYNEGKKGSKVRVRAKIEEKDKRTLVIRDIPYGTTTVNLMESIVKANDNGKIKIKKVVDNTAAEVEIEVQLHPGTSPDMTIDALYAFTDCELSISPNACVIIADKPHFVSVNELLRISTQNTLRLLERELEIRKAELDEKWHFSSLEKIFIEKRIYRKIEECETWEAVIEAIDKGLNPYKKLFKREVTRDDIIRLTEIKIKRISKYDAFKADEAIRSLEEEMAEVLHHLANLVDFAVNYFKNLLKKYGKGRERKTEIRAFDTINANTVAVANQKLYVNYKEGFIGYGLKKDEFVEDCSDIDDIITFRRDGTFKVTKIKDKEFVGKDIIHAAVWKKNDERMIYNMIYVDAKSGISRSKRFAVTAITRDKEYDLTMGNEGSKVLYFSANPNSEAETVTIYLSPNATAKNKIFDFDFSTLEIKGRSSQGNILSKYAIRKVQFKEKGASTLGGRDIWYDKILGKLNVDKRGKYLGQFDMDDSILVVYKDGSYELTNFDLINKYEAEQVCAIEKWKPERVISAVYYDSASKLHYAKRFVIETTTVGKKFSFIPEVKGSKLLVGTTVTEPKILVKFGKKKTTPETHEYLLNEIANVKGWKAMGTKLTELDIQDVELLPSQEEGVSDLDNYDDEGNLSSSESSNIKEMKTVVPEPAMAAKPMRFAEVKEPVSFVDVEPVKVEEKPQNKPTQKPQILSNEEFVKNKQAEKPKKEELENSQLKLF